MRTRMDLCIELPSQVTTPYTMMWSGCLIYIIISTSCVGQNKPTVDLKVHHIMLADIFLIREKAMYVRLKGVFQFL